MNVIWRLMGYMRPFRSFVPFYILTSILAIIFGAINFTLLAPLLKILFLDETPTQIVAAPTFSWSFGYFTDLFNHNFSKIIVEEGKMEALYFVCKILIVTVFLSNVFRYLALYIINKIRFKATARLQNALFNNILALDVGYFSQERKGDLMSRFSNDAREVETSVYNEFKGLIRSPLTFLVYFSLLVYWSWKLTLFAFIFLPISGGIIALISRKLRKSSGISQTTLGDMLSMLDELLSGIKIVSAFNAQNFILSRFKKLNERYRISKTSYDNKRDIAAPLSEFLGVITISIILLYGGNMVFNGQLSAEIFIAYIAVFSQIIPPIKEGATLVTNMQRGIISGRRVFEVLDSKPSINELPSAKKLSLFSDKIEIKDLHFSYKISKEEEEVIEKQVLNGINLSIKKGEIVALVGMSGGGKSTLADLVARFYDPQQGDILLDNISLKDYTLHSLRSQMGIVTQEAILFNDTIFNNIAFGIETATPENVENAAKIANAHDFIIKTEEGYQTNIGDRGSKLSGGQRQRISIARAVLKNPAILILDEATSALDSESEHLVQEALYKLMEGRTTLVIAHRLSTIQHADKIVVINDGKIMETGTHQNLIEKQGAYSKLVEMQMM
ncbi:ABC-type multidrug transport system, ATPase and permease component [Bernardetia litoralis DSM 6794]|uniref:ABC-type multidrug transport system, ATPase and permease component n=1 Tax=Bernardetia litoralis (strain ATCC 23117 / DSM 6794 / NBRC 15988 / NCIMB 1366 / Fx l1 / Sio-4) TaxID=880071 RepID=I4AG97_BERLS|nr:ABC transporter ATP-binding protein [Bernardetia litoralis]AFM02982.1 ABC-type multidrug transport system, ATPase and permease component [Bernardetia litoralis DSM 6794]